MIDHVLGRPSVQFRKIQVLAVLSFWSCYVFKGDRHGPRPLRKLSKRLSRILTPWQTLVLTILYLYIARNLGKLLGLECPEPLANLYSRSYFRATWVTTALDAGFWSAMRIRRKWMRDLASVVFSVYYLIAAEQAEEKVRKVRGMLTIDHLRVSWNKGTTPYLSLLTNMMRPRLMKYPPRAIRIPRPSKSDYNEPVQGWLYFDGPLSALKKHTKIVLDIPGGGFVAMDPRTNDDKLFAWAGKTGLPVLSLNYKKAPEFPYPYALNECFDVYTTIIASRGQCLGLTGEVVPKVVICGDSAGANLAVSCTLMIIESLSSGANISQSRASLPIPDGMVLIYPGLDMNIGNWMSDEQMALIKDRRFRQTNKNILQRKSMQYTQAAATPHQTDDEDANNGSPSKGPSPVPIRNGYSEPASPAPQYSSAGVAPNQPPSPMRNATASHRPQTLKTRLAMTSMISYFNDRILSPEMMRAMILLYIGPHNRPDFSTDYLLSPILAPDSLLALFPKTCFLTGERDPLVDDTVIFAGRLRKAKAESRQRGLGATLHSHEVVEDPVEIALIPGVSHGFMQFLSVFPEGWKYTFRCGRWIEQLFALAEERELHNAALPETPLSATTPNGYFGSDLHLRPRSAGQSSGEEDPGLEMSFSQPVGSKAKGVANGSGIGATRKPSSRVSRKNKERLLREQLEEKRREHQDRTDGGKGKYINREKSLVSLASEEDLLGRRMLGLVGSLTGAGEADDA